MEESSLNRTSAVIKTCSATPSNENLAIAIVLAILCTGILIGNLVVTLTVLLHRKLHSMTIVMVVSLATADLFVSMFSLPWRIHFMLHDETWCLGKDLCGFWIWTDSFACCASICNLAAIGIERFIAIKFPLRYPDIVNRTTGTVMIIVVWMYATVVSSLGLCNWTHSNLPPFVSSVQNGCFKYDRDYYTFVAVFAFVLPESIIVFTYAYLTKVALSHHKAIRNIVKPSTQNSDSNSEAITRDHRTSRFFKEIKSTKMMVVVVGAFTISWLPFFLILLLALWNKDYLKKYTNPVNHREGKILGIVMVSILPYANSFCNPLIYIAFTRELRQAIIREIYKLLFCARRVLARQTAVTVVDIIQDTVRRNTQQKISAPCSRS